MFPESTNAWTSKVFALIWNLVSTYNPGTLGSLAETLEISGTLLWGRGGGGGVDVGPGEGSPGDSSFFGCPEVSPFLEGDILRFHHQNYLFFVRHNHGRDLDL